ncbi:Endoglucanase, partial [Durusdinium trenchii]
GLLMRQQPGFTSTTLYLAKEVRLCATWLELEEADGSRFDSSSRTVGPGDLISLPLDEEPEAAMEACQRACLDVGKAGFALDGLDARLLEHWEAEELRERMKRKELRPRQSDSSSPSMVLLEPKAFFVGLEMFNDMDAFAGSDARVLKGRFGIAQCREICLQEGFCGFAIQNGVARFRSAAAPVLRERLLPSRGTVFYILTTEEVSESSASPHQGGALQRVLTKLWSPSQAALQGGRSARSLEVKVKSKCCELQ